MAHHFKEAQAVEVFSLILLDLLFSEVEEAVVVRKAQEEMAALVVVALEKLVQSVIMEQQTLAVAVAVAVDQLVTLAVQAAPVSSSSKSQLVDLPAQAT